MAGFLFHDIVFGPVRSRRFGISLGINLLPLNCKVCSFNCIYCECGLTGIDNNQTGPGFIPRQEIANQMQKRFEELKNLNIFPDNITFAGNGEPTLHPDFPAIINDTIELRNQFFPAAQITVLSNATLLHNSAIRQALQKVDNNVLKLDAGTQEILQLINRPLIRISLEEIVENLKVFNGNLIIQGLFLRGKIHGREVDNATDEHLETWLKHIKEINPQKVMIYSIDRATPEKGLERLKVAELESIALKVNALGVPTEVYS